MTALSTGCMSISLAAVASEASPCSCVAGPRCYSSQWYGQCGQSCLGKRTALRYIHTFIHILIVFYKQHWATHIHWFLYIHSHIHTYIHTYIHTPNSLLQAYIPHTYIHSYYVHNIYLYILFIMSITYTLTYPSFLQLSEWKRVGIQ